MSAESASWHPRPHPTPPPHHRHHHPAWLLNWLNQSCRWSDLALPRCETISSGPPRPPTATDPQPRPAPIAAAAALIPRITSASSWEAAAPFLFSTLSLFSGRDSPLAGPSAANYIKFPARRKDEEGKSLLVLFIDSAATLQSLM